MKKKKTLIAIVSLLLIALVGATFAYYTSNTSFENVFNTGKYKVVVTEEFTSPDKWLPGNTVPKTVTAKNEGTVDAAVRISYVEEWVDKNGVDITSQINPNPAIINFANQSDWTKEGNYYYYNYILKPNKETSSFMSSVTLDPNLNSVTCTGEGTEKLCSATNPVSGAKYKLTLTIETIQYNVYKTEWNTNHDIVEYVVPLYTLPTGKTKDTLEVGDEICINGDTTECFNFIGYDGDNIKMLSKWNLKVGTTYSSSRSIIENYTSATTGYGLQDSEATGYVNGAQTFNATVPFSATNYWDNEGSLKQQYGQSYPGNVYDNTYITAPDFTNDGYEVTGYSVAYYVEQYRDRLVDYGATVSTARLLTYSEATDSSIGCSLNSWSCPTGFIRNTSFWLETAATDTNVLLVGTTGDFAYGNYLNEYYICGVRPVIVVPKTDI